MHQVVGPALLAQTELVLPLRVLHWKALTAATACNARQIFPLQISSVIGRAQPVQTHQEHKNLGSEEQYRISGDLASERNLCGADKTLLFQAFPTSHVELHQSPILKLGEILNNGLETLSTGRSVGAIRIKFLSNSRVSQKLPEEQRPIFEQRVKV